MYSYILSKKTPNIYLKLLSTICFTSNCLFLHTLTKFLCKYEIKGNVSFFIFFIDEYSSLKRDNLWKIMYMEHIFIHRFLRVLTWRDDNVHENMYDGTRYLHNEIYISHQSIYHLVQKYNIFIYQLQCPWEMEGRNRILKSNHGKLRLVLTLTKNRRCSRSELNIL